MSMMGIREFSKKISSHIDQIEKSGAPTIVTRHGRPVVAIIPLNADGFEDFVLAHVPEFTLGMRAADEELRRGETKPLDEVLAEIEQEERTGNAEAVSRDGREPSAC
jgi:antitoxin (DNA-binding transcriptional repressor) of toxin-antitoxin stability system